MLGRAYALGALSARGRHRVLRVARTIADLEAHERVTHARRADGAQPAPARRRPRRRWRVRRGAAPTAWRRTWLIARLAWPPGAPAGQRGRAAGPRRRSELVEAVGGAKRVQLFEQLARFDAERGTPALPGGAPRDDLPLPSPTTRRRLLALDAPPAVLHVAGGLAATARARWSWIRWQSSARGERPTTASRSRARSDARLGRRQGWR